MSAPTEESTSTNARTPSIRTGAQQLQNAKAASQTHKNFAGRLKFQMSRDRVLKLGIVFYLGLAILAAAIFLPALRIGRDSPRPLPWPTEQGPYANLEPDKARDRQEQAEMAERWFAACVAEKSAETAARLEAQGEISHRDKLLFSTSGSEIQNLTSFGQREILSFRRAYEVEQVCTELSQSSPRPGS
jgi:hypothetical protein